MNGVELKPCPFCGGEARTSSYRTESLWSHNTVTYTKVSCDECDVAFRSEPGFEVEAPEKWNTRPTPSDVDHVERVKVLEEALAPFADFGEFLESETEGFDESDELSLIVEEGHLLTRFKVRDFRAALAALPTRHEAVAA